MSIYHDSFVYIWYDSNAKMFYLGVHKGTPDDKYTHSSSVMESFKKNNIPRGFRRRILATGTLLEMNQLETDLLMNRWADKRKWGRYYNVNPNSPTIGRKHSAKTRKLISDNHADVSGKNNPMYGVKNFGPDNHAYGGPGTFKGKKHSPETKARMAEAAKKRWAKMNKEAKSDIIAKGHRSRNNQNSLEDLFS